jgi:hypothetical protein
MLEVVLSDATPEEREKSRQLALPRRREEFDLIALRAGIGVYAQAACGFEKFSRT